MKVDGLAKSLRAAQKRASEVMLPAHGAIAAEVGSKVPNGVSVAFNSTSSKGVKVVFTNVSLPKPVFDKFVKAKSAKLKSVAQDATSKSVRSMLND